MTSKTCLVVELLLCRKPLKIIHTKKYIRFKIEIQCTGEEKDKLSTNT
jgi:hypothetical protein